MPKKKRGRPKKMPRQKGKFCAVCYGLPWRVPGLRCGCGLRRGPEVYEVHLHRCSPMAFVDTHAPEGDDDDDRI